MVNEKSLIILFILQLGIKILKVKQINCGLKKQTMVDEQRRRADIM